MTDAMRVVFLCVALACASQLACAHDDYLPLKQPDVIESPCVTKWKEMAAHFQSTRANDSDTTRTTRTRPLAFENEPSELQVNLTVQMDRFESRYVGFNTRTYNGKVPAPTIKVCPGDKLLLRITNELGDGDANMTNVHLHGLVSSLVFVLVSPMLLSGHVDTYFLSTL